jgi:hypothetical protein
LIAGVLFSHAFSGELQTVSVVNEAVQDGVAEGGVADNFVPMFDGNLAGDDGRGATVAIIKDLQKVAPLGRTENRKAPIVEYQELNAAEGFEHATIAAVAASKGEGLEQARDTVILDRTIVAAGFVAEGAGNPALAEPGCSSDEQVLVAVDPVAADEPSEDGAVDTAWRAQVDVFHACALAQCSELEACRETFGVALGGFAIDQQSDALLERQGIDPAIVAAPPGLWPFRSGQA